MCQRSIPMRAICSIGALLHRGSDSDAFPGNDPLIPRSLASYVSVTVFPLAEMAVSC